MATLEQIKELRTRTGAGVNAVREAIEVSGGDMQKAVQYLREKGMAKADKRKGKVAEQGVLGVYVHSNSKLVTVVEVACETDFAAKSEDLMKFANDLALHIAATSPKFISEADVSQEYIDGETATMKQDLEGKPEEVQQKIMAGKLEKVYSDVVLLKQKLFTDDSKTVADYLNEMLAKIGEKIEITRFYKFQVAEATVTAERKGDE